MRSAQPAVGGAHLQSSPQRHCGPHAHATELAVLWQPHAQLEPEQGLQPQVFWFVSFMAFSPDELSWPTSAIYGSLAAAT